MILFSMCVIIYSQLVTFCAVKFYTQDLRKGGNRYLSRGIKIRNRRNMDLQEKKNTLLARRNLAFTPRFRSHSDIETDIVREETIHTFLPSSRYEWERLIL